MFVGSATELPMLQSRFAALYQMHLSLLLLAALRCMQMMTSSVLVLSQEAASKTDAG
jgi:hypothetical protein